MSNQIRSVLTSATVIVIIISGLSNPRIADAHCDSMEGPVITTAKSALEKGEVISVLKWVKPEAETEIRAAFDKTLAVRSNGPQARELADTWFFETLVRLHRAGEGAPYTGLKSGGPEEPAIAAADKALNTNSVETLVKMVIDKVAEGIHTRFKEASEKQKHQNDSVAAGREFVAAYVEFVHYVERLDTDAQGLSAHANEVHESGAVLERHDNHQENER